MSCLPYNDFIAIPSLYEDLKPPEAHSFAASPPTAPTSILKEQVSPTSATSAPSKSASISTHSITGLSWKNRFSTHRLSPLFCPNQDLVAELGVVRQKRELEGEARSASAYQMAIAVGCPGFIRTTIFQSHAFSCQFLWRNATLVQRAIGEL
jgi:hypothetical protein